MGGRASGIAGGVFGVSTLLHFVFCFSLVTLVVAPSVKLLAGIAQAVFFLEKCLKYGYCVQGK